MFFFGKIERFLKKVALPFTLCALHSPARLVYFRGAENMAQKVASIEAEGGNVEKSQVEQAENYSQLKEAFEQAENSITQWSTEKRGKLMNEIQVGYEKNETLKADGEITENELNVMQNSIKTAVQKNNEKVDISVDEVMDAGKDFKGMFGTEERKAEKVVEAFNIAIQRKSTEEAESIKNELIEKLVYAHDYEHGKAEGIASDKHVDDYELEDILEWLTSKSKDGGIAENADKKLDTVIGKLAHMKVGENRGAGIAPNIVVEKKVKEALVSHKENIKNLLSNIGLEGSWEEVHGLLFERIKQNSAYFAGDQGEKAKEQIAKNTKAISEYFKDDTSNEEINAFFKLKGIENYAENKNMVVEYMLFNDVPKDIDRFKEYKELLAKSQGEKVEDVDLSDTETSKGKAETIALNNEQKNIEELANAKADLDAALNKNPIDWGGVLGAAITFISAFAGKANFWMSKQTGWVQEGIKAALPEPIKAMMAAPKESIVKKEEKKYLENLKNEESEKIEISQAEIEAVMVNGNITMKDLKEGTAIEDMEEGDLKRAYKKLQVADFEGYTEDEHGNMTVQAFIAKKAAAEKTT